MAVTTGLMTVAEFLALPGDTSTLELHHGEVVDMGRAHARHRLIQYRLARLLEAFGHGRFQIFPEMPFRALPEHEARDADVGAVAADRWEETAEQGAVAGAPDLVAEVLSPSNSAEDMLERERLCLANGCREFWWVDARANEVRVTTADGVRIYRAGMEIPVLILDGERIAVDAIFAR